MRSDVDAEEMFMQLIDKVESPLGHVWLDGVSVSPQLQGCALLLRYDTVASADHIVYRISVIRNHIYRVIADYYLSSCAGLCG